MMAIRIFFKNWLILFGVLILAPFFYLAIWLRKYFLTPDDAQNILIIDNAKIGDLICTTPIFRAIKEKYPRAKITVLVIPRVEGILKNNKNIDKMIVSSLNSNEGIKEIWLLAKTIRAGQFGVCFNLVPGTLNFLLPFFCLIPKRITSYSGHHSQSYRYLSRLYTDRLDWPDDELSIKHFLKLLKFIGIENENFKKEIFVSDQAKIKAEEFLRKKNIGGQDILVGFSLTAGNKIKEWGVENFGRLAEMIVGRYNYKIIVIGAPADQDFLNKFDQVTGNKFIITSDFPLDEIAGLINRFHYFISVDSGPLYIASALDVPVIDIIGPFNYPEQAPYYEACEIVVASDIPCWPCLHTYSTITACPLGRQICLEKVSPELVFESFEKLTAKYGKK